MAIRSACLLVLALGLGGCVDSPVPHQASAAPSGALALAAQTLTLSRYPVFDLRADLGESLMPDEEALVRRSMDAVEEVIRLRARDKNIGRGDHAKALGCYRAAFTVSPRGVVRTEDQVGIAKPENLGRTFEATVRLSNSEPRDVSDLRSATTGLAVKVTLDPTTHAGDDRLLGEEATQDFVAGGLDDRFVSRSIVDYAELFELRIHPYRNAFKIWSRHPEAFSVFGAGPLLRSVSLSATAAPLVLEKRFSSLLPYAWGAAAVKFRFEPCRAFDRSVASFSRFDAGYQTKVLADFLRSDDVCYVMKVQPRPQAGSEDDRRVIAAAFPIEDATVRWPEPDPPTPGPSAEFREVARVTIERGTAPMADETCESLAFNPWNGLKAHQPLGSLNRARLAVYQHSESVRKQLQ
jgi:hypothetical protein